MRKHLKSNICFLLAAMIWGLAFVAQCDAADKINMFLLIGIRYLLGALAIIPVILIFDRKSKFMNKKTVLYGAVCGAFLFTASALQQWGINLDPNAGKAGFITGTYTVLVPIFYFLFFRKKTGVNVLIGAVCAIVGLYLLSFGTNGIGGISFSDTVIFIGAFFWAGHIILIDKFVSDVSPIKLSFVQFLTCSLLGFVFTLFNPQISLQLAFEQLFSALLPILYMGICSSGIAYTLQVVGQKDADPTYSAIILSTESVFAAIGGVLFGVDKAMGFRAYLGCAVIFVGILFSQISFKELTQKLKKR